MLVKGSCRAPDLLRLPGRALDSPANDQPDRKHVCHRAIAASPNQRQRLTARLPHHGLQADAIRLQKMEAVERFAALARRDRRSSIHRWNQIPSRRLKTNHPQLLAISRNSSAVWSNGQKASLIPDDFMPFLRTRMSVKEWPCLGASEVIDRNGTRCLQKALQNRRG